MDKYTLYLDESYTYKGNGQNPAFAIGGFIIKDDDIKNISSDVDNLKQSIWGDLATPQNVILHELNLKDALNTRIPKDELKNEYKRFRRNKEKATTLYSEMSKIIKQSSIHTVGCVVLKDKYSNAFPKDMQNEISLVCMQIIIENYTHFLFKHNAIGKIVYESRDDMDKTMLMRFYQISSIGTMYVKPQMIQQKIYQFVFRNKKDNDNCLQVADFIPNQIARKKSGKNIYRNVKDLTRNIFLKSYDGDSKNTERYGIKVVPRMN